MNLLMLCKANLFYFYFMILVCLQFTAAAQEEPRVISSFDQGWKLYVGEANGAISRDFDDAKWRSLDLPHDGSIEGDFSQKNPAGAEGGYLPTGFGYYRKTFFLEKYRTGNSVFIDFDGVYRNSEVWINGHYLGKRPNGYISFRYDLTSFVSFGAEKNVIVVKVDNRDQPNSRWYTGSGIYRNVWLTMTGKTYINHWGIGIKTKVDVNGQTRINIQVSIGGQVSSGRNMSVRNKLLNSQKSIVVESTALFLPEKTAGIISQEITVDHPHRWSDDDPYLYTLVTQLIDHGKVIDELKTPYGVRSFYFSPDKGFILNERPVKIKGVCNHHDLGCLGAAVNKSAMRRQLKILKEMGCNGIRMAHNPPAPELLDLCDEMGFIVMDEAFDSWTEPKTKFDYHLDWDTWHERDLRDMILRDRNHPSIFIWSIGNEITEQYKDKAGEIARKLSNLIRTIDSSRPVTAGNNHPEANNKIISSGALDLVGWNYLHQYWKDFPAYFPGKSFICTESVAGFQTRGEYTFPSDNIYRWGQAGNLPVEKWKYFCPAFDQVTASWGATHEETLKAFTKFNFVSGMFVWSGFDYLGEPTPYGWPARSSCFGIIDLAGFPKDVYYLYQSEWTKKTVLHLFPHWNWKQGEWVDVWAYYNNADEVELFLNGKSLGVRKKSPDRLHVMWRVQFQPGILKVVSRKQGRIVAVSEQKTAGAASKIVISADRKSISAKEKEISFLTITLVDGQGNPVPDADKLIFFDVKGNGNIAGVDNGNPISHEKLKGKNIKTFHGMAIALVQAEKKTGDIIITANSQGLPVASFTIHIVD